MATFLNNYFSLGSFLKIIKITKSIIFSNLLINTKNNRIFNKVNVSAVTTKKLNINIYLNIFKYVLPKNPLLQ